MWFRNVSAVFGGLALVCASVQAADRYLLDELLAAADKGVCIERAAAGLVAADPNKAGEIVVAAIEALQKRRAQQRELGCGGDLVAQMLMAGADPNALLEATASGRSIGND